MKFKLISIIFVLTISLFSTLMASPKMYIDSKELDTEHDSFHIHLGHNVWIETNRVNRDRTGLFTFENDILRSPNRNCRDFEAQKTWKCPYCYHYWPLGTPCQNPDCPSRYK